MEESPVTRVLIADKIHEKAVETISNKANIKCFYQPALNSVNISTYIKEYQPDVVIVNKTKVTEQLVSACPSLRCVIKYGSDLTNIDTETCSQNGIFVATCNGQTSSAVAELTLGLIIAVNRRILDGVEIM